MEIGAQIEHYVIMDHIGRGGMADVWSARDTRLKRMIAIKTIGRNLADEADYLARFEQEAQTIAELEHPHILPIYGFGDIDNQLYIVMRYVSGGTLFDRLVDGPLPTDEIMRVGHALASALDYAHRRNVVHLDLKPLNVLVDSQEIPYLADFGLAMRVGPEGSAHSAASSGSIGYMAPEQMAAEELDQRADIFSFGVMLYHMFTGQMPFGENSMTALMIMSGELLPDPAERVDGLPATLAEVLRRATALNIDERPNTAGELLDMLVEIVESSTGDADTFDLEAISFVPADTSPEALAALEAQDIFFRALTAWGQGKGQFVLSMADFMLVGGYYQPGGQYGDELDDDGRHLMLRGAIEYNYDLPLWLDQVSDLDAQRNICLHALRSGIPGARARAIELLAGLPDAKDQPVIVRRVARALGAESDERVRAASIALMETRGAPVDKHRANAWRPAVYTEAIDERLAEEALKSDVPAVAEAAAHTAGKIRSIPAVELLAAHDATSALARARAEAPDLPRSLPWEQRARVFFALTRYKIDWNTFIWRYIAAAIFGMLGFGGMIFALFGALVPGNTIFALKRILNAVGVGVPSGLLIGLMVLLTVELPERLRDLWAGWLRVPLLWLLGDAVLTSVFAFYYMGFQNIANPDWPVLIVCSSAITGTIILSNLLRWPLWARVSAALVAVSGAALVTYYLFAGEQQIGLPLIYFSFPNQPNYLLAWELSLLFGLTVSLGAYFIDIPHSRLVLGGLLVIGVVQGLVGLAFSPFWAESMGAAGVWLTGLGMIVAFVLGGAVTGWLASTPRRAGLAGLMGGALYSFIRFVLLQPAYAELAPDLAVQAASLDLAQLMGGPLLAGAVAVWVRCRLQVLE